MAINEIWDINGYTLACIEKIAEKTDSNKFFSASRDFLGGLAAIFSRLILGLTAIFAAAAA